MFADNLCKQFQDSDQDQQSVGPDLDPLQVNCVWHSDRVPEFKKKVNLDKILTVWTCS